jgi:hypothetical protein
MTIVLEDPTSRILPSLKVIVTFPPVLTTTWSATCTGIPTVTSMELPAR